MNCLLFVDMATMKRTRQQDQGAGPGRDPSSPERVAELAKAYHMTPERVLIILAAAERAAAAAPPLSPERRDRLKQVLAPAVRATAAHARGAAGRFRA